MVVAPARDVICSAFPTEVESTFPFANSFCVTGMVLRCARAPKHSTSPDERRRSKKNRKRVGWRQAPRRSASQVPEHSPPFQEPVPVVPESLPEPVALLLPALTVTVIWPLLATLPLMVAGLEPSARRAPLWMRIG